MEDRLATISTLKHGSHKPDHEYCVMEAVAYVAGEPWSDHPACACPVLTAYAIQLNDRMLDDDMRTRLLLPLVIRLAGSKSTPAVESQRMFLLADRGVLVFSAQPRTASWVTRPGGRTGEEDHG